jgi:hypothetical protein
MTSETRACLILAQLEILFKGQRQAILSTFYGKLLLDGNCLCIRVVGYPPTTQSA